MLTLVVVFPVKIAAWVFVGLWFLYQLVEVSYRLFSASANGGGVGVFRAHWGSCFGVFVARAFLGLARDCAQPF